MKDGTFNMAIGVVVGIFLGAAITGLGTKLDLSPDRLLVVSRPDGTEQKIKLYRGDDCARWGKIMTLTFGADITYSCESGR
jgi:hypothetical protein